MQQQQNASKTDADRAHLYRVLGRSNDEIPMPFQVSFQADGSVMLRYNTVEEVDAAVAFLEGRAGHDTYTHNAEHRTWHSYGTRYGGGRDARWVGWPVQVWAAVDGPAPEVQS